MKYNLFDLTASDFENLCADLLNSEYQFDKYFITDGPNDGGIDILALKGIEKIAIQIKHRYRFNNSQFNKEIEKYKPILEFHHKFIFITSAQITKEVIESINSKQIQVFAQNEIELLLDKHSDVAKRYFSNIEKKKKQNKKWLSTSLVAVSFSLISILINLYQDSRKVNRSLSERIINVEQTLSGIKNLESDLESIKSDMIKTDLENKRILEEYNKIKGLEHIVNEKKDSLKSIISYEPWYMKALNYFLGIITGIFTSIIASILYERWKLKKELNK